MNLINDILWTYILIAMLLGCAIWFTIKTRFVQFRMIGEMLGKEIKINYQHDPNSGHYQITPYAFMPKVGRKMTPHLSTELGQGVLKVMEEIHQELHPDLKELGGYLMVDKED